MSEPIFDDPVVAEIHAIRGRMLADCGGDHRQLMFQVQQRQRQSGRLIIAAPQTVLAKAVPASGVQQVGTTIESASANPR